MQYEKSDIGTILTSADQREFRLGAEQARGSCVGCFFNEEDPSGCSLPEEDHEKFGCTFSPIIFLLVKEES